ncbi:MAG: MarR family transcriptional regulator [Anaerolinea sp.]|nr:MarR family transcriptional regulator [Anaerolinea sp.]
MTKGWTPTFAARQMLEIMPGLGRMIAFKFRDSGEEETTIMQAHVLLRIMSSPTTVSDIAKMRRVSMQSASVLVQALVDRGWLTRIPDPNDRRQSLLQVTPEGAARAQAVQEQMTHLIAALLEDLTPEELDAAAVFLPALRRLIAEHLHPDIVSET